MRFAVIYATTEGQTQKIARFVQERLTGLGHEAEFVLAEATDWDELGEIDGAVLAGSVHAGGYQKALVQFATENAAALNALPSVFLSVSLTAAGDDPEDHEELRAITARLAEDSGWTPDVVEQVAGALKFSEYDFFRYWAVRWIAKQKFPDADPGEDREFTDWDALGRVVDRWAAGIV